MGSIELDQGLSPPRPEITDAPAKRFASYDYRLFAAFFLLFGVAEFLSQILCGAYGSDLSQTGDEAAHFVTSLMIHDYLRWHVGENFVSFAKAYYAHFPRVGLGHWPPVFELTQALVFFASRTAAAAMAVQALIYGLYAGLPAWIVSWNFGRLIGLGTGLALFFAPVPLYLANTVMADNFLGVLVVVSALCWHRLYQQTTLIRCLVFGAVAAAAILTKGSAIALGLLPVFHAWAIRDARLLWNWRVLISGAAIVVVTAPWYLLTYRLAAAGFNYSWGFGFTELALARYPVLLGAGIGIPMIVGFVLGTWRSFVKSGSDVRGDVAAYVAAALALLVGVVVMPADIGGRYLVPAYPCMAVVAVSGLAWAWDWMSLQLPRLQRHQNLGVCGLLLVGAASVFAAPHIELFGARGVARSISGQRSANPLVLVSGSARFEGAMIAVFALQEKTPLHYVVRATKVLASGNFMGTNYAARFSRPEDLQNWLIKNEIGFVAICADRDAAAFSHNAALANLVANNPEMFRKIDEFRSAQVHTVLYRLRAADRVPSPQDAVFREIKFSS